MGASRLLLGLQPDPHVDRQPPGRGQVVLQARQVSQQRPLVVTRAPAVDSPAGNHAAEWRSAPPGRWAGRLDVEVPVQQQHRAAGRPPPLTPDAGRPSTPQDERAVHADPVQLAAQQLGGAVDGVTVCRRRADGRQGDEPPQHPDPPFPHVRAPGVGQGQGRPRIASVYGRAVEQRRAGTRDHGQAARAQPTTGTAGIRPGLRPKPGPGATRSAAGRAGRRCAAAASAGTAACPRRWTSTLRPPRRSGRAWPRTSGGRW